MKTKAYVSIVVLLAAAFLLLFIQPDTARVERNTSSSLSQIDTISVSLKAGDLAYESRVPAGSTVLDLMDEASSTAAFRFKTSEHPGLGLFIEEIAGKKNADGAYWTLYVNGEYSTLGATNRTLVDGDAVEWRYVRL